MSLEKYKIYKQKQSSTFFGNLYKSFLEVSRSSLGKKWLFFSSWSTLIPIWMVEFYLNSALQFQPYRTLDTSCPNLLLVFMVA